MLIDIESVVTRLYEDVSLTEELTDEPAKLLLKWGRIRLNILVENAPDEETFVNSFKQLRRVIKSINRFTARRHIMSNEEQREYLEKIMNRAQELGLQPPPGASEHYLNRQRIFDDYANIYALTQVLEMDTHLLSLL